MALNVDLELGGVVRRAVAGRVVRSDPCHLIATRRLFASTRNNNNNNEYK
jgi:hypothetical protein